MITVHPFKTHLDSLPNFPGLVRASNQYFTPAQAELVFKEHDLPKKGYALVINFPNSPLCLCRVTRLPIVKGNSCRFSVEYFRKIS